MIIDLINTAMLILQYQVRQKIKNIQQIAETIELFNKY